MSIEQVLRKGGLALSGLMLVVALGVGEAEARADVFLGFDFGVPFYPYYPPPYYVYPPPVVYTSPPVIYTLPPPVVYQQQSPTWYYCDNPQGYYPYVTSCATGWRQVPATPSPGSR